MFFQTKFKTSTYILLTWLETTGEGVQKCDGLRVPSMLMLGFLHHAYDRALKLIDSRIDRGLGNFVRKHRPKMSLIPLFAIPPLAVVLYILVVQNDPLQKVRLLIRDLFKSTSKVITWNLNQFWSGWIWARFGGLGGCSLSLRVTGWSISYTCIWMYIIYLYIYTLYRVDF